MQKAAIVRKDVAGRAGRVDFNWYRGRSVAEMQVMEVSASLEEE